jgi:hypothetical protein
MEFLSHADYNIIFENKEVQGTPVGLLEIGNLSVSSGEIVACDPLVFHDIVPLSKKINPGNYPVKIYIAKTENAGDRYAVAKLELSNKKAEKWVLALRNDDDINELKEKGDFFGFPVDAGLGGFMDYEAALQYDKFIESFVQKNPEGNIYDDFFAAEFKKNAIDQNNPQDYGDWVNFKLPGSELNITMFQSGYGDGVYPAYWGIDKEGQVTSLVIDFLVLLLPEGD